MLELVILNTTVDACFADKILLNLIDTCLNKIDTL